MPDGKVINIRRERFKCPEMLFNPRLFNKDCNRIVNTIIQSIATCHNDIRTRVCCKIILSGGTTMLSGMIERAEKEIKSLSPPSVEFGVRTWGNKRYVAWVGVFVFHHY